MSHTHSKTGRGFKNSSTSKVSLRVCVMSVYLTLATGLGFQNVEHDDEDDGNGHDEDGRHGDDESGR